MGYEQDIWKNIGNSVSGIGDFLSKLILANQQKEEENQKKAELQGMIGGLNNPVMRTTNPQLQPAQTNYYQTPDFNMGGNPLNQDLEQFRGTKEQPPDLNGLLNNITMRGEYKPFQGMPSVEQPMQPPNQQEMMQRYMQIANLNPQLAGLAAEFNKPQEPSYEEKQRINTKYNTQQYNETIGANLETEVPVFDDMGKYKVEQIGDKKFTLIQKYRGGRAVGKPLPDKDVTKTALPQGGFAEMTPDIKKVWYEEFRLGSKVPPFAYRDAKSRDEFIKGYGEHLMGMGIDPTKAVIDKASYATLKSSLAYQQKVKNMMGSFVNNIDFQVERLNKAKDAIDRTDVRLLNLPLREFKMKIKGSADESILSMYLTDISNDAAKLSTGSSGSIAELSVQAQEKWANIHDPNLSVSELINLIKETQIAAHGRISSADDEITNTKEEMNNLGKPTKKALPDSTGQKVIPGF